MGGAVLVALGGLVARATGVAVRTTVTWDRAATVGEGTRTASGVGLGGATGAGVAGGVRLPGPGVLVAVLEIVAVFEIGSLNNRLQLSRVPILPARVSSTLKTQAPWASAPAKAVSSWPGAGR